ncbi:hypothetical protein EMCRGX_G018557 [Ephydatia muelleri]
MADVVTANAAGSPPQEQTVHQTDEVTAQIPASQLLKPEDESSLAAPVEAHVPVSVPKPEPPKGAKDGSPEDNAGESDSDAGEGGGGKRVGSSRRRRKHSSASEDQEEKEDEEEEADGSEVEHDKEGSHISTEQEGRGQEEEEGDDEEGNALLPKKDPSYVPTKGGFYLHDDRFEDTEQEPAAAPKPPEAPKQKSDVNDRWTHDLRNYESERRPARSRKLNSFLSDSDQKRMSQGRGEDSWNSRGGRGYSRSDGKRGGRGRTQHWGNRAKEGVPPKGEIVERKEPAVLPTVLPTESLASPQDGSQKVVVEKSSVKDVVDEWPDLQPNRGDQMAPQQQERGAEMVGGGVEVVKEMVKGGAEMVGGGVEVVKEMVKGGVEVVEGGGETGKGGRIDDNARATEMESKETHESSKAGRQEGETLSRPEGTGKRGPNDSAHHESNASVAHWENSRGGRQGNRRQYGDDQRQRNRGPYDGDKRLGNRGPYGGDQRQRNSVPYKGDQRQRNRGPYEGDQRQKNRGPYEGDQRQRNRGPYEGDQRQRSRDPYEGDQRQKWSRQRSEGLDRRDEGGDVRSGRNLDAPENQEDRGTYRKEGNYLTDASRGKPRRGGGGRFTDGYKRNEHSCPSDQSDSHLGTTPPGGRVSEGPASFSADPRRANEEGAPRDAPESGKSKSLFHTGETEGTKSTKVYSLSAEEGMSRLSVMTSSGGMGRGRGWKERLESPRREEVVPTAAMSSSSTTQAGVVQKSNIKVIESLEQRLSVGKMATSSAETTVPPMDPSVEVTSPPKDKEEFEASGAVPPKEKGVGKSGGTGEEEGIVEGTQATKPKRYSSRRQQKTGESGGDLLMGSEDVIQLGYGPHGNPMVPMPWMGNYQAYLAHQMQQMKLMMSQPPPG